MAVHFKFKAAKNFDSINIDGHFITVANLKDRIIEQKHLGNASDFDLLITDAQTGEDYTDDIFPIPRNTSVIVKRVPATRKESLPPSSDNLKSKAAKSEFSDPLQLGKEDEASAQQDDFGDIYSLPVEPSVTSTADDDEAAKLAAMVKKQSTDWQRQTQEAGRGFGRGSYGRGTARGGSGGRVLFSARNNTPPVGYICHRCGQAGHYIQHCPTNGDPNYDIKRVKPPSGIPRTRLQADEEGSLIAPDGRIVKLRPDEERFEKEADALLHMRPTTVEPPPELRCPLCKGIFRDAVLIPCCQETFCDQCIRDELIANGKCPQCGSSRSKNDDLMPNKNLRQAVDRFKESLVTSSAVEESVVRSQQRAYSPIPASGSVLAAPPATSADRGSAGSGAGAVEHPVPNSRHAAEVDAESQEIVKTATAIQTLASTPSQSGPVADQPTVEAKPSTGVLEKTGDGSVRILTESPVVDGETETAGKSEASKGVSRPLASLEPPPVAVGGEHVAIGPEASKGSKSKKKKKRAPPADMGLEPPACMYGKVEPCPNCGSFEHPPWECPEQMMGMGAEAMAYSAPYPGMFGSGPPNMRMGGPGAQPMVPPYSLGAGYWGPSMAHMPHYPGSFPGAGMYEAGPAGMMYEAPMMRGGGMYGPSMHRPPFPPVYHGGPPLHSDYMPVDMMGHDQRTREPRLPTREEFEEMQLVARRRKELAEQRERRKLRFQQTDYHDGYEQPEVQDGEQLPEPDDSYGWGRSQRDARKNPPHRSREHPPSGHGEELTHRVGSKRSRRQEEGPPLDSAHGDVGQEFREKSTGRDGRHSKRPRSEAARGKHADGDEMEHYDKEQVSEVAASSAPRSHGERTRRIVSDDNVRTGKSERIKGSTYDEGDEPEEDLWPRSERSRARKPAGRDISRQSSLKYEGDGDATNGRKGRKSDRTHADRVEGEHVEAGGRSGEEALEGRSVQGKKRGKARVEYASDEDGSPRAKKRHKKHRDTSKDEPPKGAEGKAKVKKPKKKDAEDMDGDARWPMVFEAEGVELARPTKRK